MHNASTAESAVDAFFYFLIRQPLHTDIPHATLQRNINTPHKPTYNNDKIQLFAVNDKMLNFAVTTLFAHTLSSCLL